MKISKRKALPASGKAEAELERALNDYLCGERSFEGLLAAVDKLAADKTWEHDALAALVDAKCGQLDIPPEVRQGMLGRLAGDQRSSTATLINDSKRLDSRVDHTLGRAEAATYRGPADTGVSADEAGDSSIQLPVPVMQSGSDMGPDLPRPGAVLNHRYELIRCVGAGGSSNVYKALDRRKLLFDDPFPYVAIKVLNQRFRSRPDWPEALRREAARCQQLNCPNIVKVYDVLKDGTTVYIVMEYLSGAPLTQTIRTEEFKGLPAEQAVEVVNAMGRALAYAHEQGIVHCDFKPANIFVTQDGEIKLIDFGIARMMNEAEESPNSRTMELFEQNAVTPAYASPELLERSDPDPRDDVYSLACTAYELFTGQHPYGYKPATLAREEKLTVPRHRALTRHQWRALRDALALARTDRTVSIGQFISAFNGIPQVKPWYLQAAAVLLALSGVVWLYTKMSSSVTLQQSASQIVASVKEKSDQVLAVAQSPDVPVRTNGSENSQGTPGQAPVPQSDGNSAALQQSLPLPTNVPAIAENTAENRVHPHNAAAPEQQTVQPSQEVAGDSRPTEPVISTSESQGTSKEEPEAAIAALFKRAEEQKSQNNWVRPEGASALDSFRDVLRLEPDNVVAQAEIEKLRLTYVQAVRASLDKGDTAGARHNLRDASRVAADDGELMALRRELDVLASRVDEKVPSESRKANDNERKARAGAVPKVAAIVDRAAMTPKTPPVSDTSSGLSGLQAIAERLKERALVKQRQGALSESQALVTEGLRVQPDNAGLLRLRQAIEHQQQTEAAQRADSGFAAAAVGSPTSDAAERAPRSNPRPTVGRDPNLNFGTF